MTSSQTSSQMEHSPQNSAGSKAATSNEVFPAPRSRRAQEAQKDRQATQELLAGRPLPSAPAAERSVLGSVLLDPDEAMLACGHLTEDHFHLERHRVIWRHMRQLEQEGQQIDLVTLVERLNAKNLIEQIGGADYLISLSNEVITSAYAEHHAGILDERLMMRRVIQQSASAARKIHEGDLEGAIATISTPVELSGREEKTVHNADALRQLLEQPDEDDTMSTGVEELDEQMGGLKGGHLYILAARPSMGKTMLSLQIALNVAQLYRKGVLFASLEMPAIQLQMRLCAQVLGIHQDRIQKRDPQALAMIAEQIPVFEQIPLYYEDNQDMSLRDLEIAARKRFNQEGGLGLIVIDYLQLVEIPGTDNGNRNEEISKLSRSLKKLARRLNVPIIVLSQLSRKLESRPDKRPILSDLRDSGAIEQDADVVMFIYRDEYYNADTPEPGVAEVIIGKQRSGPLGTIKLAFKGASARFASLPGLRG